MSDDLEDLGFIVEEDQSDQELPEPETWQSQYNKHMHRGWKQGHKARTEYPDMKVEGNPYLARDTRDLVTVTRALGWEDGFVAAGEGRSIDDCPYPEG